MTGDDRVRHCAQCNLNVYNFAAMTTREVEQLIAASKGQRLCGRLYRRADGMILTRDCPVGVRARIRMISRAAGAALSAAMSLGSAAAQTNPPNKPSSLVQIQQTGSIDVVVTDPTGAVIPKAQIAVVSPDGITKIDGTTNSVGRFRLSGLALGQYEITAQSPGFKTFKTIVTTPRNDTLTISLPMEVQTMMGVVVEVTEGEVLTLEPSTRPGTQLLAEPPSDIKMPPRPSPSPRQNRDPHPNSTRRFFSALAHKLGF